MENSYPKPLFNKTPKYKTTIPNLYFTTGNTVFNSNGLHLEFVDFGSDQAPKTPRPSNGVMYIFHEPKPITK